MSSSMLWQPVRPTRGHSVPCAVKKALSPKFFHHDGSLGGDSIELGPGAVDFLEGVVAVMGEDTENGKAVRAMLDAIEKYGAIEVWFEV